MDKNDASFHLLYAKIEEHKIEQVLSCNIDEIGLLIGVGKRSKRCGLSTQVFLHGGI